VHLSDVMEQNVASIPFFAKERCKLADIYV
jgi:hypothetical protein